MVASHPVESRNVSAGLKFDVRYVPGGAVTWGAIPSEIGIGPGPSDETSRGVGSAVSLGAADELVAPAPPSADDDGSGDPDRGRTASPPTTARRATTPIRPTSPRRRGRWTRFVVGCTRLCWARASVTAKTDTGSATPLRWGRPRAVKTRSVLLPVSDRTVSETRISPARARAQIRAAMLTARPT